MFQYTRKAERLNRNAQIHKARAASLRKAADREIKLAKSLERAAKLCVGDK